MTWMTSKKKDHFSATEDKNQGDKQKILKNITVVIKIQAVI